MFMNPQMVTCGGGSVSTSGSERLSAKCRTAPTVFVDIYWIRVTYTLASHERAMLAAYTEASDAAGGTGKTYHA